MNPGIKLYPEMIRTEQWFYASGAEGAAAANKNWQIWQKPKQCQFVSIFALGAGAGGGNGFTRAAGAAGGGGGGGGSGAIARAEFLASMLPDNLWIQVPRGGSAGVAGGRSWVALSRSIGAADTVLTSGNADAGAGGTGTGAAVGAAGAASTVAVNTASLASLALQFTAQAGQAGGAGGAVAGGAGTAVAPGIFVTGGGGGGGTTSADFAGGNISTIGTYITARPQVAGGAAGSNNGADGYSMLQGLLINAGGGGGGASNAGVGGNGGAAGYGSGGGGGGAGTTGGTGGRGGDGLVIITTW